MTFNGRTGAVVPQDGDYDPHMVRARPNRKLLRNGYFIGGGSQKGNGYLPINQKNLTAYSYQSKSMSIDGWFFWGVPSTMQLTDEGLVIGKKGAGGNGYVIFEQTVDENVKEGEQLTASVLLDENELITLTLDPGWTYAGEATLKSVSYRNEALWIRTTEENQIAVRIYWGGAIDLGKTSLYKIIGLEYGDRQTIVHKDKNGQWVPTEVADYDMELFRCRRHFRRFPANWSLGNLQGVNAVFEYGLNPPMAKKPVVTLQYESDLSNALDDGRGPITPTSFVKRTISNEVVEFCFTGVPAESYNCIFNKRYVDVETGM